MCVCLYALCKPSGFTVTSTALDCELDEDDKMRIHKKYLWKTMIGYTHPQTHEMIKIDFDTRLKWSESNKNVIWG